MKPLIRLSIGILFGVILTLGGVALFGRLGQKDKLAAPSLPEGMGAVITHTAGPVFILRGEDSLEVIPGEQLQPGDVVKVTEGAMAQVQLADKGNALLGSDTLVRFIKLTGADRKLELRTEILTGSLSYKVEKLDNSESIIIRADNTDYEITGTEFVLEKRAGGSILIVGEGSVKATGDGIENRKVLVNSQQQLLVRSSTSSGTGMPDTPGTPDKPDIPGTGRGEAPLPASPEPISEASRRLLKASAPLPAMPFGFTNAPKPVRLEITTTPPDAQIYIDGLKTGIGKFSGLLPQGTSIDIRVRRRGFTDYSQTITVNSSTQLDVKLKPTSIEDTLKEPPEEPPIAARLRADYERRLAELRESFAGKTAVDAQAQKQAAARQARRENEIRAQLELEKARGEVLATELAGSQAENQKLRELLRQIGELSDKENDKQTK